MGGEVVVVVVVVVIEPFLKPVGWQSNTVLVVESLIALEVHRDSTLWTEWAAHSTKQCPLLDSGPLGWRGSRGYVHLPAVRLRLLSPRVVGGGKFEETTGEPLSV